MRAFISWSGGKDCTFALNTFLETEGNSAEYLVHFTEADARKSRSHGISTDFILAQANAMEIPLLMEPISNGNSYRYHLKMVIAHLKSEGITAGVFGDIYLEEHRTWIESVCEEMGIEAIFPLWGRATKDILDDFLKRGFKSKVVAMKNDDRLLPFLGTELNKGMVNAMSQMEGVDVCGENGEYHTFVFDGPLFSHPVKFKTATKQYTSNNHIFQCLELL